MSRLRLPLLLVVLAGVGFAPAPLPRKDRQRDDQADLTGQWVFVRCDTNGRADPPETYDRYRIEITRTTIAFNVGGPPAPIAMSLEPAASPPMFTWTIDRRVQFVGSYRLRRNELTMIFKMTSNVEARPKEFDGAPEYRYVMRRVSR